MWVMIFLVCTVLVQIVQDSLEKVRLWAVSADVARTILAATDHIAHCVLDALTVRGQIDVLEKIGRRKQHGSRVGYVETGGRGERVARARLEYGAICAVRLARNDASAAN